MKGANMQKSFDSRSPSLPEINKSHIRAQDSSSINSEIDKKSSKLHLKSVYSMLLKLGVLHDREKSLKGSTSSLEKYERVAAENRLKKIEENDKNLKLSENLKKIEEGHTAKEKTTDPNLKSVSGYVDLVKKLLMKSISLTGGLMLPKLSKSYDPILFAAERILVQTEVIKRRKKYKHRLGESKVSGYAPRIDITKLRQSLNM